MYFYFSFNPTIWKKKYSRNRNNFFFLKNLFFLSKNLVPHLFIRDIVALESFEPGEYLHILCMLFLFAFNQLELIVRTVCIVCENIHGIKITGKIIVNY